MEVDPIPELNKVIQGLPELIRTMVRNSLDALVKLDDQLAREIIDMDDKVDDINKEMYVAIKKAVRENPGLSDVAINLLSTSRYMERIGDLSTNIAEDVIFMVEGKVIRHAE